MKKIPLYIDTDMGVDDIVALCMIVASNRYEIKGISVVNGVSSVPQGVKNLNRILSALNISCPIYAGVDQKVQGSSIQFPALDRKRANSLALLPKVQIPAFGKNPTLPLTALIPNIISESQPFTYFCIGPLSNIPSILSVPQAKKNIQKLIIMGGTLEARGIVPPTYKTEYNVRLDPKAANQVFTRDIPITLIPLDATQYVPTRLTCAQEKTKTMLARFYKTLRAITPRQPTGVIIKSILLNNKQDFSYFYDPLAAAILLQPTLVKNMLAVPIRVSSKPKTYGQLVREKGGKFTINAIMNVNTERFYKLMLQLCSQYTTSLKGGE